MVQCEVLQAGVNILTFIPLLHLIPEGGMSPLPVRKDSGGKAIAVELCVYLPTLLKLLAAVFHLTQYAEKHTALVLIQLAVIDIAVKRIAQLS